MKLVRTNLSRCRRCRPSSARRKVSHGVGRRCSCAHRRRLLPSEGVELRDVDERLFGPWKGQTRPQRHGREVVDCQVFHQYAETQGRPCITQDIGPGADQWGVRHGDIIDPGKPQALQVRVDVLVEEDFTPKLLLESQVADHLDEPALPGPGRHGLRVPPVPTLGHHLCWSCPARVGELQDAQAAGREAAAILAGLARDADSDEGCWAHVRTRVPGAITPVLRNARVSQAAVISWRCLGTGGPTVCPMTSLLGQAVCLLVRMNIMGGACPVGAARVDEGVAKVFY